MRRYKSILFVAVLYLLSATPASAWDDIGHEVVAYIAWQHMTPEARSAVIDLMRVTSLESGLAPLFPSSGGAPDLQARIFFMRASTWPDIVRSDAMPTRRARYHRSNWHYINYFWDEQDGTPHDREDIQPAETNIVERLEHLVSLVQNEALPKAQRGLYVAWILHLVGDLHQPLHTSARITDVEPRGDQGGNLFKLADDESLHWYWDSILDRSFERPHRQRDEDYAASIATTLMAAFPPPQQDAPAAYAQWAQAGYETAKKDIYLPSLERGEQPSETYRQHAYEIAAPAIVLAGHRLATLLNNLFA